ncbi:hypothetical protein T09_7534 [Trichinella sp. T9]|nr:hypothetical protein T09_7534 [Trichinella sp. T9]
MSKLPKCASGEVQKLLACKRENCSVLYYKNESQRFWKVPRQTNAYVSNKWPLKLPCAYLNTQGSSPSETPLIPIDDS